LDAERGRSDDKTWDRAQKKTLSQRIDGDLLEAIVRAREIDERLVNYRSSGQPAGRLGHERLIGAYLDDLTKRADAGEIDSRTLERYRAPLQHHYLPFVAQPDVARRYQYVTNIDRNFQLEFARFLQSRQVSANGRPKGTARPMRGQPYVLEVVRSMLSWAADGARGNLLPTGFQNPFRRTNGAPGRTSTQVLSEPDITMEMAAEFLSACNAFQLPIFGTLALFGLRPDELGWIFWEDIHGGWVRVIGHPDLSYQTKGRRDKQFPAVECLAAIWPQPLHPGQGLLFHRRAASVGSMALSTKPVLVAELQRKRLTGAKFSAFQERRLRDAVLRGAGQLHYDYVKTEFEKLAKQLGWQSLQPLSGARRRSGFAPRVDGSRDCPSLTSSLITFAASGQPA
jgi:hypothetical protein